MLKLKLQYLATWCEELTHWQKCWCWERLKAGGEGDDRGWDGWMASLTQWTWVWTSSRSWWWTGKPGMLPSMGLQRIWDDWATKLNWTEQLNHPSKVNISFLLLLEQLPQPSVQFSCSVVSDSLQPHESQHARLPCPSPTPGVYPNSCPSSWWCHPSISSSVVLFSRLQSFPASGSSLMSWLFPSGG